MIKINNITKYFGANKILDELNYTFYPNCCYVIQGESGIGKTTLLNIIMGYVEADEGIIETSQVSKMDYLFQDELLFSNLTVIENLALKYYANNEKKLWNINYLKEQLKEILCTFRIEDIEEKKIALLSGGERQRVLLAGMIISKADVLLLDEPVTKVDQENREMIIKMIEKYVENRVVIIVSHVELDFQCDVRRLELRRGKLYEV